MDIADITYTDSNGDAYNALEHLTRDGNLQCFSEWGSTVRDCAPFAILLFLVHIDGGADDTVELLEEMMGHVVNDAESVAFTIVDNVHAFGQDFNVTDYLETSHFVDAIAYAVRAYDYDSARNILETILAATVRDAA